jgi:CubicO group peptidase (beta-lactamase class C family)
MRVFIAIIIGLFAISCTKPASVQDIPMASPESVGMDEATLEKMTTAIRNNEYSKVHSVLIARNGKLVYEEYFKGEDQNWGDPIGEVTFDAETLHDIRSISKSVVSACIGIAMLQGKLKDVNQRVFDFFPEYEQYKTGDRAKLTIEHLLTMSSGLRWNEDVPYDNPENGEIQMTRAADPIEFVLSREMDTIPGVVWKYNGGTTQVLAAIIKKVSGQEVDEFAKENLFGPLGITNFEWIHFPATTIPAAASGVRLRPRDMLKFGLLYYNGGSWNGKQILSKEWVEASFTKHVNRGDGGYGYQFWMWNDPYPMVIAVGNGDQRIFFNKQLDLVVVTTAGNYNRFDSPNHPGKLLQDFIYPAATTSSPR